MNDPLRQASVMNMDVDLNPADFQRVDGFGLDLVNIVPVQPDLNWV